MEVRQVDFDARKVQFKNEPDVSVRPEETDSRFGKVQIFKTENGITDYKFNFESQSTEQFANVGEIKQEIIEWEEPKIEQRSDLSVKIEDTKDVPDVIGTTLLVNKNAIKHEVSEHLQIKIESELLTSHCDLPTLKYENAVYSDDFEQPCSSKQSEKISKSLKSAAKYVRYKKKRRYKCPVCLKSFPCSKSSLNHIVGHFGKRSANNRSPFWKQKQPNDSVGKYHQQCFFCGRFILNRLQFLEHFILYHYVKKLQTKSPLKCKYCLNFFVNLDEHIKVHTEEKPFKCETCSKQFSLKCNLKKHLKIHTRGNPFECEICSKQFIQKSALNYHLITHTEEKPFKCAICSKQFNFKYTLKRHLNIHADEKQFNCKICSKQFAQITGLNYHLMTHAEEKPFKCEICSKQFIQKIALNYHLMTHTEEKLFKCARCSKQFDKKCNFKRHLDSHVGKKSFNCEICWKQFSQKGSMKFHLKLHTEEKPFNCKICSKQFKRKNALSYHLITHTEEKPFKCVICSKQFNNKSNFKRHLNIHADEKPFNCKICSKQFTRKYALNYHLMTHTEEKPFKC